MRPGVEELRERFPHLRPLTGPEVSALARAAFKRLGTQRAPSERVAIALLLVVAFPAGLLMTAWMWLPLLSVAADALGPAGPLLLIGIVAIAAVKLARTAVVTDRVEIVRASGLLDDERGFLMCLGCEYDLAGLAPEDGRPSVVRCPECGLVYPTGSPVIAKTEGRHVALRERHPALCDLTDMELERFIEAALRGGIEVKAKQAWSVGRTLLVLVAVCLALFTTAIAWGPLAEPLFDHIGYWGVVPALALLAFAGSRYVTSLRRVKVDARAVRLDTLIRKGACVGCGYELEGIAVGGRPGVARCPECGLVNPAAGPALTRPTS